jgi:hypothetical protein
MANNPIYMANNPSYQVSANPSNRVEMAAPNYASYYYNPGSYQYYPYNPQPQPQPQPTPAAPTTPQQQFGNLMAMLSAIPIAVRGDVITSDHHNLIRSALLVMAAQLGLSSNLVTTDAPITLAPGFVASGGDPIWRLEPGKATRTTSPPQTIAKGWMNVSLPHKAIIKEMKVFGARAGATQPTTFKVQLMRQQFATESIPAPVLTTLISVDLKSADNPFNKKSDVAAAAQAQAAATGGGANTQKTLKEDYEEIDNDAYKYIVTAEVTGATADAITEIHAIQIVCG